MRIVQLTPGTGNFYCGSCLRDHALVTALRAMGHDAVMVPLYLPAVTEVEQLSPKPILFGGINVYLQQLAPLFRWTPDWLDRWLDSAAILRWASNRSNMTASVNLGDLTLSMLRGEDGHQAKELAKLIKWLKANHGAELVSLSNSLLLGLAGRIKAELGVPIVCSVQGEDQFVNALPSPYDTETWELLRRRAKDVDAFIACSQYYADIMSHHLDVPAERMHVVYNGIDVEPYSVTSKPPERRTVGYLARLCRAKGLHTLVDAFVALKQRAWAKDLQLSLIGTCVGADAKFIREMARRLRDVHLSHDVHFHPNVSLAKKVNLLQSVSVLSVPVTYGEAFGLYVLEALAAGVPVVQPRCGVFPELLDLTGGGILFEPGDVTALANAIESILERPDRGRSLGLEGRANVRKVFTAQRMAESVMKTYENVHPTATTERVA